MDEATKNSMNKFNILIMEKFIKTCHQKTIKPSHKATQLTYEEKLQFENCLKKLIVAQEIASQFVVQDMQKAAATQGQFQAPKGL